ncbi:MAG: hypothetical protein LKG20_10760 [Tetrasphaera jenkinsii]|jgi:hypothetical protein|nr:hypothetical protein [Tetrasphaera jenkinsii]
MTWVVLGIAVLLAAAWYLSYSAARLDRLHAQVEGALSALDAHLVRRAEATLELANSGALDPASALLLAGAASESLERTTARLREDDLLDGQHFGGRESVESELTQALTLALTPPVVASILAQDGLASDALERVEAAGRRVQLARRFLNNSVKNVQRVRGKVVVRLFRLAGHADLPQTVEFDDEIPAVRSAPGATA